MGKGAKIAVIDVCIKEGDGVVLASSPQIPEFHLCAKSIRAIERDAPALIQMLYKLNYGIDVAVEMATDPMFQKPTKAAAKSFVPEWLRYLASPNLEMAGA
jgi:hypothetical protein